MNGRIYDPLLGRMLSADTVVQVPGDLQCYNRYSYVANNPLSFTDPTGYYAVFGLEFTDGGGVGGFFKDLGGYGGDVAMGAVGDSMVAGYHSGTDHMTAGMAEIANAHGALDATIGTLHMVASVGEAVGVVMNVAPGGKAEKVAVDGVEKLATKAESAVTRAVEKTEGNAGTIEKRVEGVTTGAESTVKSNTAPATEALGGAHGDVKGVPGNESHHMPADSASPVPREKGPAISMEKADHQKTASWGPGKDAKAYRAEQKALIDKGDFKGAQNMDIKDVRSRFGDKYDKHIEQMEDYTKKLKKPGDPQ